MAEQIEMTDLRKETSEQLTTLSKYAGLGASNDWFLVWHGSYLSCSG